MLVTARQALVYGRPRRFIGHAAGAGRCLLHIRQRLLRWRCEKFELTRLIDRLNRFPARPTTFVLCPHTKDRGHRGRIDQLELAWLINELEDLCGPPIYSAPISAGLLDWREPSRRVTNHGVTNRQTIVRRTSEHGFRRGFGGA